MRTVTTTFGVLRGETVSPDVGDLSPVTQYLGVPYGVAPSGQYRFNMAISAAKWTHLPKDANKLSPVCIQSGIPELSEAKALKMTSAQRYDHMHRLLLRLKPQSEDCLYMNLFVPERIEPSRTQLPVLVIVHGDEYGWNSGNPYNGTIIASSGQIIVVTLNYRLGVFGLSDLVAALKMLSNTLPAFGGDSSSVTLLGWGSGSALVSLLMASPITQPNNRLFRRAILLDGSALAPWAMTNNPQPFFYQLAEHLKCVETIAERKRGSRHQRNIDSIVRCMQDHGPHNVTNAAHKILVPTFLSAFAPIVDGQLSFCMVPNRPLALFGAQFGSLFRDIDLLVGVTSNPAHHLLSNDDLRHGITKERREKIFRTLVRNLYDYHRTEILAAIINEYTDWENPKDHPKTIRNGVLSALSDILFTVPTIETARLHSIEENHRDSNTFMFVFAHETRQWMDEQPNSGVRGSISGDHIPYILGYPLSNRNREEQVAGMVTFCAEDRGVSQYSSDPSKPVSLTANYPLEERFHSTAWPQFNQANREAYLEISDRPRVKNYYRNAQVGFWNGFVPQLHNGGREGAPVPEEHNFLPNHFKRDSFFGTVRPFGGYANDPFPPPPLPPTPLPKDLRKLTTPKPTIPVTTQAPSTAVPIVNAAQNSTMLSVTVAVGCGLLFLNICIGFGLYRQCNKREESKKKLQLQYQTYAANHQPGGELNYSLNSPMNTQVNLFDDFFTAMPPPPPPPLSHHPSIANSTIGHNMEIPSQIEYDPTACRPATAYHNYPDSHTSTLNRSNFQEQEPLLSSNSKGPPVQLRPGVSPTCPRHGRAAMALATGRNNTVGTPNSGPTLEEIQV
ncbi:unnamed protein product [Anisakis simplex]|uniref:Neuroligin-1 (inferred by orthology to a C. elegans protein) n=1 Tax=Anisakis simplex TaxID=6269 RepID=A0A0M3JTK4_ANISI|nr:unnamed protein product [Anisakis simplex]